MFKKWIAFLLAAAMLLSLTACGADTEPTETTQAPSEAPTETTEPTTQGELTEQELFAQAGEALLEATAVHMDIEAEEGYTVNGESYSRQDKATAIYEGLQGELLAKIEGKLTFSDESYLSDFDYTEQYLSGVTYATFGEAKHKEETNDEDYLARQIPLCLFDAANFGEVETINSGISTLLKFSAPTALESWVAADYAELISAEASAKIENGTFVEMRYSASYIQGAAEVTVSYKTVIDAQAEASLSAEAPADAADYTLLSDVEAPRLLEQATFNLYASTAKSTQFMKVVSSQAAAYAAQTSTAAAEYGEGASYVAKISNNITEVTQDGQQTYVTEEQFAKGNYSYYVNGELSDEGALDAASYSEGMYNIFTEYLSTGEWLTGAELHDLGEGYLLEFTSDNEDCLNYFKSMTMQDIFGDNTVLDDSASAYEHKELKGYMGIDKDTRLPSSYSVEFQGVHTIEGANYVLSQQIYGGFDACDPTVYGQITEEALPEAEPEEKATPLFYRVTDESGNELWLLGTIHVGDEKTAFLPQEVYTAFDAADALAVEFDMNKSAEAMAEDENFAQMIASMMLYTDGTTAADHLDEEVYDAAVRYLKYCGEYNATAELMKVSMWETTIANAMLAGQKTLVADKGMDMRLLELAEKAGKEILNVESMESQMQMLTGFSDELQQCLLASVLASSRSEYIREVEELYAMWCQGDEAALKTAMVDSMSIPSDATAEEKALLEEYWNAMSTDRDQGMIETAKGYLSSGKTVFYAVGLAHLLADGGLLDGLRAAGYTVELVSYAE
ncbi:MAG: TraB/GumN family protein [Oscillospiraceae bacterium]|nr:TraB/GumN family protein [Oscillospiraceae bacterium]